MSLIHEWNALISSIYGLSGKFGKYEQSWRYKEEKASGARQKFWRDVPGHDPRIFLSWSKVTIVTTVYKKKSCDR